MPVTLQITMFQRYYGMNVFHNANLWPTDDAIIPRRMFSLYYQGMLSNMALERITEARAVRNGLAQFYCDSQSKLRQLINTELHEAFGIEE